MDLSEEAWELYEALYVSEWSEPSNVETVAALMQRAPVMALRIAMILACLECTTEISIEHLRCGIAWVRYWQASVEFIWQHRVRLAEEDGGAEKIAANAQKVMDYLSARGDWVSRSELSDQCFKRHLEAAGIDEALSYLETLTPPAIRRKEVLVRRKQGPDGKKTLFAVISQSSRSVRNHQTRATEVIAQTSQAQSSANPEAGGEL